MPTFRESKTFLAATPPPVPPAGPKEILEMQRRLTEEGSNLAMANAKAQEIEKEIARLKGSAPSAPNFDAPRELLLADIAVDKATKDDLKKFDSEIAVARKAYDATVRSIRERVSPLESTFAGLRRRAAIVSRTIESLRTEHRRICQEYLLAQAEREGERYAVAINAAVEAMARAIVLGSFHKRVFGENSIGVNYESFDVIGLGCESTKGTLPLTDPVAWSKRFDDAESQILESLKAEGIAVPFPTDVAAPAKVRVPGIGEGVPVSVMRPPELLRGPDGVPLPTHALTEAEE